MTKRSILTVLALLGGVACVNRQPTTPPPVVVMENKVPGTVDHYWVEPMYDTVKVPGQLDPTGTYYRPSHQTIVEVKPNRFEKVQYDGDGPDANHPKKENEEVPLLLPPK